MTTPYKVVLATVGSLGDLHPFMAVGLVLQGLGLDVVLATAEEYRGKVESAGLAFHAIRPSFEDLQRDSGLDRAALTRALLNRGDFLFRRLLLPYLRAAYDDLWIATAGADAVLSSSLAFSARLAAERRGIPCVAVVLQPMMFLSAYDPPAIPHAEWLGGALRRLGPKFTGGLLWILKRAAALLLAPVGVLRHDLGLPLTHRDPLFDGQFSDAGAIGLYSPLLGAAQPDHPPRSAIVGFAEFDSESGRTGELSSALDEFLAAGPPPLVFTLGSLVVNSPGTFYRESAAAARRLNKRAVLLAGDAAPEVSAGAGGPDIFVCAYAPHSLIFSRAEIVVHHAGIGTLAQALRSGRPQLIVPFYADQVDNAARAVRLGVAVRVAPERYDAGAAVRSLAALANDPRYASRAVQVRVQLLREHGARHAAERILELLRPAATNGLDFAAVKGERGSMS